MKSLLKYMNASWVTPEGTYVNVGTVFGDDSIKWEITGFVEDGMNYKVIENGSWGIGSSVPQFMPYLEAKCIDHYRIWKL